MLQKDAEEAAVLLAKLLVCGVHHVTSTSLSVLRNLCALTALAALRGVDIQFSDRDRQTQFGECRECSIQQFRARPGQVRMRLRTKTTNRYVLAFELLH